MKYFVTSFSLLLICSGLFSQTLSSDAASQTNAVKDGTTMAKLLLKKDYKRFTAFTYAPLLKWRAGLTKWLLIWGIVLKV